MTLAQIRGKRKFLPTDFKVTTWKAIVPYFEDLLNRSINSVDDLLVWLRDRSELDSIANEDFYRRYINKTRDTENKEFDEKYEFYAEQIQPKQMEISNKLNIKLNESIYKDQLDPKRFKVFIRSIENDIALFRKENIDLIVDLQKTANQYYSISGQMTIQHEKDELTIAQAGALFESKDRALRADIYSKVSERRLQDKDKLDDLFDDLIQKRHQIALNAGFENYRDYKLQDLGRFDYGTKECMQFHDAIESSIIPILDKAMLKRKEALALNELQPYDTTVGIGNSAASSPFKDGEDLINKTIECLNKIDPFFGQCLSTMKKMEHLDLESRKGKAPGGYNCNLPEVGVPFIFMNAAQTARDVKVMIHESGHAIHSFLMNDLTYNFDKALSSEMAELASMSMELFAIDQYNIFYENQDKRNSVIYNFLEGLFNSLAWIALIDKFQHWIYTHPNHSRLEREEKWIELHKRFSSKHINWEEHETIRKNLWQRQLHLFMVPFYYIEYGIAQLGAINLWQNFKKDPSRTIAQYKSALSKGYTIPIPDMYEEAGIKFDFSQSHIKNLGQFVVDQLN